MPKRENKRVTILDPAQDPPRRNGVRDPRPLAPVRVDLVDPRAAANRDRIELKRRVQWTKLRRESEPQPWLMEPSREAIAREVESSDLVDIDDSHDADIDQPVFAFLSQKDAALARKDAQASDKSSSLTMLTYRYTKGLETVNDEMGYGERIHDVFWRRNRKGALKIITRTSQRTKSGRQQLRPEKESG
jgi:hypothetical protein